jgi:hypothetical protein
MNSQTFNIRRAFQPLFGTKTLFEFSKTLLAVFIGTAIWVTALIAKEQPPLGLLANMLLMALTTGYSLEVIKHELRGGSNLTVPEWNIWKFFPAGFRLVLIENVFTALAMLFSVFVIQAYGGTFAFDSTATPILKMTEGAPAGSIPAIVSILAALASVYVSIFLHLLPVYFAANGETFTAGFSLRAINRVVWRSQPALNLKHCLDSGLILALGVGSGLVILTGLISHFAAPLTPIFFFMQQIIMANLWAQVYKIAS